MLNFKIQGGLGPPSYAPCTKICKTWAKTFRATLTGFVKQNAKITHIALASLVTYAFIMQSETQKQWITGAIAKRGFQFTARFIEV